MDIWQFYPPVDIFFTFVLRRKFFSHASRSSRGDTIYERDIRPRLEEQSEGKFVAIDIETNAYEVDADELAATDRLLGGRTVLRFCQRSGFSQGNAIRPPVSRITESRIIQ